MSKTIYVVTDHETNIMVGFENEDDATDFAHDTYNVDYPVYLNTMEVPDDFVIDNGENQCMKTGDLDFELECMETFEVWYEQVTYRPGNFNPITETISEDRAIAKHAITELENFTDNYEPIWMNGGNGNYLHYGSVEIVKRVSFDDEKDHETMWRVEARANEFDGEVIDYHVEEYENGQVVNRYVR